MQISSYQSIISLLQNKINTIIVILINIIYAEFSQADNRYRGLITLSAGTLGYSSLVCEIFEKIALQALFK